ncbi:MAG: mechanosensitive ion channel family protein, partial [Sphingomonadales bacterium]|nr:mechanosensitive ion channel family protein [Sphingomonadales bacterium]
APGKARRGAVAPARPLRHGRLRSVTEARRRTIPTALASIAKTLRTAGTAALLLIAAAVGGEGACAQAPALPGAASPLSAPSAPRDAADPSLPADARLAGFNADAAKALALLRDTAGRTDKEAQHEVDGMRDRLADDRDAAQTLADEGTIGTRLTQAEIDVLGPAPKSGESEPAALAAKRSQLENQLGLQMLPVLRWREAQARSATLVGELDTRSSAMTRMRLLTHGYSPLDPRLWRGALVEADQTLAVAAGKFAEVRARIGSGMMAGLALLALVLLVAPPLLFYRVWNRIRVAGEGRIIMAAHIWQKLGLAIALDVVSFVLFMIVLALATGGIALTMRPLAGAEAIGAVVGSLLGASLLLVFAQWLGRSVLLSPIRELRLIRLNAGPAHRSLVIVRLLGLVLTLGAVLERSEEAGTIAESAAGLLSSMLVIAGCWLLSRLAGLIRGGEREPKPAADPQDPQPAGLDFATPVSRVLSALSLVAALMALAGYVMLAREIFSDLLLSLATVTIAIYFHRAVKLVLRALAEGPLHQYRRVLHFVPMASGLVLTLGVALLVALIWGYRVQEVSDAIVALRTGVKFGNINLSAGDVLKFAVVFGLGFMLTRWLQGFLRVAILPEFGMDQGAQSALVTALGYAGILLAALVAIASTGLDLTSLAFVAGALSVGIGFGLQSVVENFTSGILLLIERPVREGDWIVVGNNEGIVRKIAVRSTRIETFDGHYIIVPNSQLISSAVKNVTFTGGVARVLVEVGVAYGSDYEQVRAILIDIADKDQRIVGQPPASVWMTGFGDSAVNFRLACWIDSAMNSGATRSDLHFLVAKRFAEAGIEIPLPQRDIHIRTAPPAALGSGGPAKGDSALA